MSEAERYRRCCQAATGERYEEEAVGRAVKMRRRGERQVRCAYAIAAEMRVSPHTLPLRTRNAEIVRGEAVAFIAHAQSSRYVPPSYHCRAAFCRADAAVPPAAVAAYVLPI